MGHDETAYLVRSAQEGSAGALEELFRRYLPRVRQIVALRLGYRQAALAALDDLVQDALVKIFENLDRYEERSEAGFRNWLATCVGNTVRNALRDAAALKRGAGRVRAFAELRSEDLASSIFAGGGPTGSAIQQGLETLERIESALLSLEERDRELIILRRLCEMPYPELAERLGLSEVAARQAFHRAMTRLERASGLDAAAAEERGDGVS